MKNQITCSKIYTDIPFAHRQHNHQGHCALIHGHNWSFKFEFSASTLDVNGFVVDFGQLKFIKSYLDKFDHALLLNEDDPMLMFLLEELTKKENLASILPVPNCGAEGLASYLLQEVNELIIDYAKSGEPLASDWLERGVCITAVTVYEDSKNEATVRV